MVIHGQAHNIGTYDIGSPWSGYDICDFYNEATGNRGCALIVSYRSDPGNADHTPFYGESSDHPTAGVVL